MKNFLSKLLLVLIFPVILLSCRQQLKEVSSVEYSVSVVPEKSVFRFSDFYDSHMVIPLSGTLISGIQDVIVLDSVLVIQGHTEDGASVSLFSRQGEYLCPLVRTGRGPGEMTDVLSIAYNPYTNTVDVLGNMGTVVNRYNIGSCELKDSFSIMETDIMAARDFCPVSEADYLFYKDYSLQEAQEYFVYLFDRGQGIVKDRFLPMDKELAEVLSFGQINNLFLYKGTAYYYAAFEKYVYRYIDGVFSPFIEFANNEYSFPLSLLEKKYKDTVDFVENTCKGSPYIWAHVNVFKYGSLIFSSYTYKGDIYSNVIDLDKEESYSYSSLEDDMVWGIQADDVRSTFSLLSTDDEYAVYSVEPFTVKEIISENANEEKDTAFSFNRTLVQNLPDDANPIILLMSDSGK